ncbi:MAG: hypothetical protein BZY69_00680, partial [SAR202 cluster bacterium Casp-Chloro-G1]
RWGDPTIAPPTATAEPTATPEATPEPAATSAPVLDRNEVLRELRLEVDTLLADGRIDDAEARMEQVRLELCDTGFCQRRINQAYFAWYGTYAARPDATDPLGPQIIALREQSGSLAAFLKRVRGAGSRADVEALAAEVTSSE